MATTPERDEDEPGVLGGESMANWGASERPPYQPPGSESQQVDDSDLSQPQGNTAPREENDRQLEDARPDGEADGWGWKTTSKSWP